MTKVAAGCDEFPVCLLAEFPAEFATEFAAGFPTTIRAVWIGAPLTIAAVVFAADAGAAALSKADLSGTGSVTEGTGPAVRSAPRRPNVAAHSPNPRTTRPNATAARVENVNCVRFPSGVSSLSPRPGRCLKERAIASSLAAIRGSPRADLAI